MYFIWPFYYKIPMFLSCWLVFTHHTMASIDGGIRVKGENDFVFKEPLAVP